MLFCRTSFGRELILVGEVQDGDPMSFLLIQQSENTGDLIFLYFFDRKYSVLQLKKANCPINVKSYQKIKTAPLCKSKVTFLQLNFMIMQAKWLSQEWPKSWLRSYPLLARKCLASGLLHQEWHWEDFIKNPKSLLRLKLVTYSFIILTTKVAWSSLAYRSFPFGLFLSAGYKKIPP